MASDGGSVRTLANGPSSRAANYGVGTKDWSSEPELRAFGLRDNPRTSGLNIIDFSVPDPRHNSSHAYNTTNNGRYLQTYTGYAAEVKGYLRKMRLSMYGYVEDPEFDPDDLVGDLAALSQTLCNTKQQRDADNTVKINTSIDFVCSAADTRALVEKMHYMVHYHLVDPAFDTEGVHEEIAALAEDMRMRKETKDTSKPSKELQAVMLVPTPTTVIIEAVEQLQNMIDTIIRLPMPSTSAPTVYVDCEGLDLGRNGTLGMVNIYIPQADIVYLINVSTLEHQAFSTTAGDQAYRSLKGILEDSSVSKGIFDCRGDSDALYCHYDISVAGVVDIQLLGAATRQAGQVSGLKGLGTCIRQRLSLSKDDWDRLAELKQWGRWAMEKGVAKAESMVEQPVPKKIVEYCTADLVLLSALCE
ncbi:hypothetical protein LTR65_000711 [Meristemomyces frigidus]